MLWKFLLSLALIATFLAGPAFAAGGIYSVANGQITDPAGNPFRPVGINVSAWVVDQNAMTSVYEVFPKLNFIRYTWTPGEPRSRLDKLVNGNAAKGIVTLIQHHTIAQVLSGTALTSEVNAYKALATTYKTNPLVWFGTMNEPDGNYTAIVDQMVAIYNGVRSTGNMNPVVINPRGGSFTDAEKQQANKFAGMINVIWDVHFYGWLSQKSTNQSTVDASLDNMIADMQTVKTADGVAPVLIGEYGPSTSGSGVDVNARQVLAGVHRTGKTYGVVAWHWSAGDNRLSYEPCITCLTDFGKQVQAFIATTTGIGGTG
jgi:hypothetical protein